MPKCLRRARVFPILPLSMSLNQFRHINLIHFLFFLPFMLITDAIHPDPLSYLRAGSWNKVKSHFNVRVPVNPEQKYALARAIDKSAGRKINEQILTGYLKVLGIDCNGSSETSIRICIESLPDNSKRSITERLAIYRATDSESSLSITMRLALVSKASLLDDDPLSARLFARKIELLLSQDRISNALSVAESHKNLTNPLALFYRAKAFAKAGKRNEAAAYYLEAAENTDKYWLLKSIDQDLKSISRNYPGMLSESSARKLVHLFWFLNRSDVAGISTLDPDHIIRTTSARTVGSDGMFLIRFGHSKKLDRLSSQSYTYLSGNTRILRSWMRELNRLNNFSTATALFHRFGHIKKQDRYFWKEYIEMLESRNRESWFRELVEYLHVNHSDVHAHDDITEFLIGKDHREISFAADSYWQHAEKELPAQPGTGRFIYWLHRYYQTRNESKAAYIRENFYSLMPGGYYAIAFWDKQQPGNYASEWKQVRDRTGYLKWVSRHGGNKNARLFLARRNLSRYWDPAAVRLLSNLKKGYYSIPAGIVELYRLGEMELGYEFFKQEFDGRVSDRRRLELLTYTGIRSNTLYVQTYFLKTLLQELNIPEDPFSLPPELLSYLYPEPYHPYVRKYAQLYKIEEEMVYGLMRQESLFRETAISRSGARGLMQVMPATGKWLAGKMGIQSYDLLDPETSIQLGTKFFADLLRTNDGDFRYASIAYNGGPGNLRKWKRNYYKGDFNLFLENIPKAESRHYCRITYQNYMHYRVKNDLYRREGLIGLDGSGGYP